MLFNSKNGVGRVFITWVVACEMGSCLAKEDDHDASATLIQHQHANGPSPLPARLTEPLPQRPALSTEESSDASSSSEYDVSDLSTEESVVPAPGSAGEKLAELQSYFNEISSWIWRTGLNTSQFKSAINNINLNNNDQAIEELQTLAEQIHAIRPSPFDLGRFRGLALTGDYTALGKILGKIHQVIEKLGGTIPPEQALSPAQPLSPPVPQPIWPGTDPE